MKFSKLVFPNKLKHSIQKKTMLSNCDNGYIPVTPLSLLKQRPIRKVQNIKSSYIVYMKKASNPLDINENEIP